MNKILLPFLLLSLAASTARAISSTEATRVITAAYEDILGRKPDPQGLSDFRINMVEKGWDEADVRRKLRDSREFKEKDAKAIVTAAYQDLLGRNPDKEGMKQFVNHIIDDKWDEKDVRKMIRRSDEYIKRQKK
jgi:hypothetical protein